MRVLAGCEFSAVVRDAFRARGHDAWSVDLRPCEGDPRWHYQTDVFDVLELLGGFDLAIFHPPCTDLATSGARWFKDKGPQIEVALAFVRKLMACDVKRWALENPKSIISSRIRKPDQMIQPWQFGHPESKAVWLWTKNLPPLISTNDVHADMMLLPVAERNRVHYAWGRGGEDRAKERSRFYPGIAAAMADQWGPLGE